jgi:hypothetical protein
MAEMTLSGVTFPAPAPYNDKDPTKQLENLCYVLLQVLHIAQGAGFKFGDVDKLTKNGLDIKTAIDGISLSVSPTDLTDLIAAIKDLQYNGETLDLGPLKITFTGKTISVSGP